MVLGKYGTQHDHVHDVGVGNGNTRFAGIRHDTAGEVHGIADVAVTQVFPQFHSSHFGAVFLGFRCRRTQMRQNDDVFVAQQGFVRKSVIYLAMMPFSMASFSASLSTRPPLAKFKVLRLFGNGKRAFVKVFLVLSFSGM